MSIELAIGLATLAGGLIALLYSRVDSHTAQETAAQEAFLAIAEAFLAYPALRALFYENEALELRAELGKFSSEDWLRANTIAELTLDAFELALGARRSRRMYRDYIASAFANSEFLREWLRRHADFYPHRLRVLAASSRSVASPDGP